MKLVRRAYVAVILAIAAMEGSSGILVKAFMEGSSGIL